MPLPTARPSRQGSLSLASCPCGRSPVPRRRLPQGLLPGWDVGPRAPPSAPEVGWVAVLLRSLGVGRPEGLVGLGTSLPTVGVCSRGAPPLGRERPACAAFTPAHQGFLRSPPSCLPPRSRWLGHEGAHDPGPLSRGLGFPICPRPAGLVVSGFVGEPPRPAPAHPAFLLSPRWPLHPEPPPAPGLCHQPPSSGHLGVSSGRVFPALPDSGPGCPVTGPLGPCGRQCPWPPWPVHHPGR